ncbi:ribonuclease 3 [Trichoderma arundinaceum]|uniref:Ribonuclease 3 n=1 Tax=Trichoderma arundinaceum TaxID=490622 RepID=A0A395P072_TRIAR|nr:ribonuclease 3 [Trichoderma arundinaceum]
MFNSPEESLSVHPFILSMNREDFHHRIFGFGIRIAMSKRPNASPVDHRAKRLHTGDFRNDEEFVSNAETRSQALASLAAQADELVDCLQSLKKQFSQSMNPSDLQFGNVKSRLSRLTKQLLPSFQIIGSLDESDLATATPTADKTTTDTPSGAAQDILGIPVLSPIRVTPWIPSEIQQEWPPLPPLHDPKLVEEAFTHPGLGQNFNYERLEWLGDAYLELISSSLIHQTFTQLRSGACSQLRERLIRNVTLAEYFRHYGMDRWARLPDNFGDNRGAGRGRSKDKDLLKTQADMFEAYVAAVILSDPQEGLTKVVEWLKALWGRTIKEDIQKAEATRKRHEAQPAEAEATEKNSKQRLSVKIVTKGVSIDYKDLPGEKKDKNLGLPLYTVGAYLTGYGEVGRLLAVGTALSKKEAGQKAAETALQNKRLIQAYEEKKRQYMHAKDDNALVSRLLG